MKSIGIKLFAAFLCFAGLQVLAAETVESSDTGMKFPKEVSFSYNGKDYDLTLTGVATRKKFFFKIYNIASYLQKGAAGGSKIEAIMQPDTAKQLTLKWVRNIEGKRVQDGYRESLSKVFSQAESSELQKQINEFVGFFSGNVKNGDEHEIRWIPGGVIQVLINGTNVGTIKSEPFAKGLWSVWFGPHSVVDRDNLTSIMK